MCYGGAYLGYNQPLRLLSLPRPGFVEPGGLLGPGFVKPGPALKTLRWAFNRWHLASTVFTSTVHPTVYSAKLQPGRRFLLLATTAATIRAALAAVYSAKLQPGRRFLLLVLLLRGPAVPRALSWLQTLLKCVIHRRKFCYRRGCALPAAQRFQR